MAKAKYGKYIKREPITDTPDEIQSEPSYVNAAEGENRKVEETKYGKYIKKEPITDQPTIGKRIPPPFVKGDTDLWSGLGVNCNFEFHCISEPYLMPDPPHYHDCDEFWFFIGGNPAKLTEFGAVIEVCLGAEWERHIIDTTCLVYIPKGLIHCPVNVKKVDKPVYFGHIMPSAKYTKVNV